MTMQELIARILADPEAAQVLAVALVSALTPVVIWIARKFSWKFELSPAKQKWLSATLVAFAGGFAVTPGYWWERAIGGIVAVLLSQGGYNSVRNLRREERPSRLP